MEQTLKNISVTHNFSVEKVQNDFWISMIFDVCTSHFSYYSYCFNQSSFLSAHANKTIKEL